MIDFYNCDNDSEIWFFVCRRILHVIIQVILLRMILHLVIQMSLVYDETW